MLTIVNMYLLPQEVEVWYLIPAIRKELARILTEEYEMSYEKAGNLLGISKAAISQYLSNKRANKITLTPNTKEEVKKSAEIISKENKMVVREVQRILKYMKVTRASCEACKTYNKEILQYCNQNPNY